MGCKAAALCPPPQCLRNKRLGWRDVVVLWDRRDPEAGTQNLEMENQGFWRSSEQVSGFYSPWSQFVLQSWSFGAQLVFLQVLVVSGAGPGQCQGLEKALWGLGRRSPQSLPLLEVGTVTSLPLPCRARRMFRCKVTLPDERRCS